MNTPIFDAGWSKFTSVQKSSEARGRVEAYKQVLELIGKYEKPTAQLKAVSKAIEEALAAVKP